MVKEPGGPYVFQPFGSVTHPTHRRDGRLWGVGGVGGELVWARIEGLTREEAEKVAAVLTAMGKEEVDAKNERKEEAG